MEHLFGEFALDFAVSDAEDERLFGVGGHALLVGDAEVVVEDVVAVHLDDELLGRQRSAGVGSVLAAEAFQLRVVRLPPLAAGAVADPGPGVAQVAVRLPVAAVQRAVRHAQQLRPLLQVQLSILMGERGRK